MFLKDLEKFFGTKNLYSVLDLEAKCTDAKIKKAYYKKSLTCHPDKVKDGERIEATEKFKLLSKVYQILSTKEDRQLYDETGVVNEDKDSLNCTDWSEYWRNLFPKITLKDIDNYLNKYRDSEEEKQDLIRIYTKHSGNIDRILDEMLAADETRLRSIIDGLLESEEVENFPAYSMESPAKKRKREAKAAKEEAESELMLKEMGEKMGTNSLEKMLLKNAENRRQQSENFLDELAKKYEKPAQNKRSKKK